MSTKILIKAYIHASHSKNDLFLDPKYNKVNTSKTQYKKKKRKFKSTGWGSGDIIVGGW